MAENINIDRLQIEIEASSADAAKQVNELADAMARLKKTMGGKWVNPIPKVRGGSKKQSGKSTREEPGDLGEEPATAKKIEERISVLALLKKRLEELRASLRKKLKINVDSKDADDATKKVSLLRKALNGIENTLKSLKRIAFYRAIRSAIKAITQAISEGLENAYEFSKITGGELAPALDRIATASAQMKNQLGAAWGQLLVALEPLLVRLINLVTKFAQELTRLFAIISGSDKYLVANEVATSWKEADKAAKAYQKTLLGIDEINRLNDPNSGGGASTPNYEEMFHYEDTNFKLPDIKNWAKPLIDGLNNALDVVGELVSALAKIPSTEVEIALVGATAAIATVGVLSAALGALPALVPIAIAVTLGVALAASQQKINKEVESLEVPQLEASLEVESALQSAKELSTELGILRDFSPIKLLAELTGNRLVFKVAEEIMGYLQELLGFDPIKIGVKLVTDDPQPEVDKIKKAQSELQKSTEPTKSKFSELGDTVITVLQGMEEKYGETRVEVDKQHQEWDKSIDSAIASAWNGLTGFAGKVRGWLGKYDKAKVQMDKNNKEIDDSIDAAIAHAYTTVTTWVPKTVTAIKTWASNAYAAAKAGMAGVAQSVYAGLQSAADNVVSFVNNASQGLHSWATNSLQTFASWATGVAQSVGSALKSAWESFKSFLTATGKPVQTTWQESKAAQVAKTVAAAITIGSIALAPFTGGASLSFAMFAGGGFPEDGLFFANHNELVGQFSNGRTAVANNEQIVAGISQGVSEANEDLITVVSSGFSQIIRAIEGNGGGSLDLDGAARMLYPYIKNMQTLEGASFVR